jgi:type II secretory pathway pseudopilin PulG
MLGRFYMGYRHCHFRLSGLKRGRVLVQPVQGRIHLGQLSSKSSKIGSPGGFTLLELLVIIIMVCILATIATPSWLGFWHNQKLATAQSQVAEVLRTAQSQAKNRLLVQQVSFKNQNSRIQWAIHTRSANMASVYWQSLEPGVQIDSETTLLFKDGLYYRVQFDHYGGVDGQLGRLTLSMPSSPMSKRCVFVSSLLGAIRPGKTQDRPDSSGRFCY